MDHSPEILIDRLTEIYKELNRYGKIISDSEWTESGSFNRIKYFLYNDVFFSVRLENGAVKDIYIGGRG